MGLRNWAKAQNGESLNFEMTLSLAGVVSVLNHD